MVERRRMGTLCPVETGDHSDRHAAARRATRTRRLARAAAAIVLGLLGGRSLGDPGGGARSADLVREIDWQTSPLDLNLRGMNGERFRFSCPPGKPAPGLVVGTQLFTDGSSICAAAVHAGVLHPADGGQVVIEIRPGGRGYRGSTSRYLPSSTFDGAWGGSFVVVPRTRTPAPPQAGTPK